MLDAGLDVVLYRWVRWAIMMIITMMIIVILQIMLMMMIVGFKMVEHFVGQKRRLFKSSSI